jgi:integrase
VGGVKFNAAIELYVRDMRSQGRITSDATERSYRSILDRHNEDLTNRDPRYAGREDVKRTLRRWAHPNTQRVNRAVLVSFYDWTMEEGIRKDNPARQTRRPKKQPTTVYRLTRDEAVAMLLATENRRERWAIYLGICCGLRNAELRGLQGRHFERPGFVWVSADVAKGRRERWVPVIADLVAVVAEIRASVEYDEYVLPAQRFRDPPFNRRRQELSKRQSSSQALRTLVMEVGARAGIKAHIHPHLMRHAYGDHIARHAGMRNAQFLLGNAGIATTETYVGQPTLEELAAAVSGFSYGAQPRTDVLGGPRKADTAREAPTRIELVYTALQAAA